MNQRKEQRSMDCIIRKATSTDATAGNPALIKKTSKQS
jgi:hypothetical protein